MPGIMLLPVIPVYTDGKDPIVSVVKVLPVRKEFFLKICNYFRKLKV